MSLSSLAAPRRPRRPVSPGAAALPPTPDLAVDPVAMPDDRFAALVKYIPTETITLFVAAMGVLPSFTAIAPRIDGWWLYAVAAALTPAFLILIGYGRHRGSGADRPGIGRFSPDPWAMAASLFAFLVWGLSVPGLLENDSARVLAAFGAVLVSTFLSLLEPVFGPRP